jgi:hypothetical protein
MAHWTNDPRIEFKGRPPPPPPSPAVWKLSGYWLGSPNKIARYSSEGKKQFSPLYPSPSPSSQPKTLIRLAVVDP